MQCDAAIDATESCRKVLGGAKTGMKTIDAAESKATANLKVQKESLVKKHLVTSLKERYKVSLVHSGCDNQGED